MGSSSCARPNDWEQTRRGRPSSGPATTKFYNDAFARQGFGDDVREVQRLWLAVEQDAARRRVPIEIGLRTNLIGPDDLVRRRLRLCRDAGVTTIRAGFAGATGLDGQLATLGRLLDLVRDVNNELADDRAASADRSAP